MHPFKKGLLSTAVALLVCAHAYADEISYTLQSQSLKDAIEVISRQSNTPYIVKGALLEGRTSKSIADIKGTKNALDAILQDSGLEARMEDGAIIIQEKESVALEGISISAQQDAATEGTGSYTAKSMNTATKLTLSMRETPQSVSVMTRRQIEDLGLTTLDDAAKNITGLVVQKGYHTGDSGSFSARGFAVSNIMVDGIAVPTGANGTFNADNDSLDIYDRVEVVRGATGLMTGSGNPSAAINLVRKRPTSKLQGSFTASAGSWDNYRTTFDIGGPLNEAKTLRARTVVTAQDAHKYYDNAEAKNYQVYAVLEGDITEALMATLGVHYRKVDNTGGYQSLPTNEDGTFLSGLSRSTNLSNAFDFWKQTDLTFFSELAYQFNSDWAVKFATNWKRPEQDILFTDLHRSSGVLYQNTQHYKLDNVIDNYDLSVNGNYALFGRSHEIMLGADYRKKTNKNWGGWADYAWSASAPVANPYAWDASSVVRPAIDMNLWNHFTKTTEKGIYAGTRLHVSDRLKFIVGSRVSWFKSENLRTKKSYDATAEFTPYAGVVYDVNENHSVYGSWTEIFQPQDSVDRDGNQLKPITGTNYEIGIKGEYYGGQLNVHLATFLIKQQNRAVNDLTGPNPCPGSTWGYCKRASGEVESKGFEAEISGAITPNWQIIAGYTYTQAEYTKDVDSSNVGKIFNASLPEHQFKLSTYYRLPNTLNKWSIGGSLYAQDGIKSSDDERIRQSSYTVVGLHTKYQWSKNMEFLLNVNNLFDKKYYETLGWTEGGNVYGAPRNATLSFKYTF